MRRTNTLIVFLMLMLGQVASAKAETPTRSISVSGTVETKIAPDLIVWRISLADTDKNIREAKARSDEKVKAVVALREKLGVGEGDLETGRVSIRREYERDEQGRRADFKHFVVSRSVTIRQRDLKRFDEFLDALVSSAEMEVGFSFESSRIHEIRAETRLRALQTAKDKAAALAEVAGAKLGRVLTIDEHPPGDRRRDMLSQGISNNSFFSGVPRTVDVATETFVPGAITVKMTMYATFALK